MDEKGRDHNWREIATVFQGLPWARPAFANHLLVLWGRVMENHPSQAEEADCLQAGETPFGNKWPNINELLLKQISPVEETKLRYVLCTLVSNAWGDRSDVVNWSKGADQTLGAGPLMALCTSTWVSKTREKGKSPQCPGCDLYIPLLLSRFTRDAHVANCCLQFSKTAGMEAEDLAVAAIDTYMYQEHKCDVCEGVFYGHKIHVLGHSMICNASNTSMLHQKHSTIATVHLADFNVMVSVTTRQPREQTNITSFFKNTTTTMAKPDKRTWTKQDAIYREAYESCCTLDGGVGIFAYLANFKKVLKAADNPPEKDCVTEWTINLTHHGPFEDTWAKKKEYFPFTLNYLIGNTKGSTRANKSLAEYTALLHKKRKSLVKLIPHGAALKLMFMFLKACKHNTRKRKDTLVASLGQDLALAIFCSRVKVLFTQAVNTKELTHDQAIKDTTPLHWALSLTSTWCKKMFQGLPAPYALVAIAQVKDIAYATATSPNDSGTESDYSSGTETTTPATTSQTPTTPSARRSRSRTRSKSPSRSRSRSMSSSRSRSRSKSPRRTRSRSVSPLRPRSKTPHRSRSKSPKNPPPTQQPHTRGARKRKPKKPRRIMTSSSSRSRSRSRSRTRHTSSSPPPSSRTKPKGRKSRSTKKKETTSTTLSAEKLQKYQKRYQEGYNIRGLSPDYWKWVEEQEGTTKTKPKKRGKEPSSSPDSRPKPKKKKVPKPKQNKHTGRTPLVHRAIPRGYVHGVITLGAPKRQGKIINQAIKKLLGNKCRVSALAGKKLEEMLGDFITKFTTCVNTTPSLQAAVEKYVNEHQQYFTL